MDKILHYPKDPKLWELWYISPLGGGGGGRRTENRDHMWEFPKIGHPNIVP